MPKAIIIGASYGLGHQLAIELDRRGYETGLAARSQDKLEHTARQLTRHCVTQQMDITRTRETPAILHKLIERLGGMQIMILNAGIAGTSEELDVSQEQRIIETNVLGFTTLLGEAYHYFCRQGGGHLVGISSIAALLPNPNSSTYNASKSFVSNYMEGVRLKAEKHNRAIHVTHVLPGYVYTPMTAHKRRMFWVAEPEKACRQMADGIQKKRKRIYVTRRWVLVAWLLQLLPQALTGLLVQGSSSGSPSSTGQ